MELSYLDSKNKYKYKDKFKCSFPVLFNQFTTLEEMNYLNLIDRAFYFIRLREKFYRLHESQIGEEEWKDEEESFYFTVSERFPFRAHEEYTWEKFINDIDDILVSKISKTLKTIKVQYDLMDVEWLLSKPNPILLEDPNLLTISPFLFKLKDWVLIIQNDVLKIYGKPVEKDEENKRYLNIEATYHTRKKLQSIFSEINDRIDTQIIKDYGQSCYSVVYIKTSTIEALSLIQSLKFHKKVGSKNSDINLKGSIIEKEKQDLRELLTFSYDKNKICTIFFIWLNLKKDEDQEKRKAIKRLVKFFHASTSTNEYYHLDIPNLMLLNDSLYEIMSIFRYLKDWPKENGMNKNNPQLIEFKATNLYKLFRALQLGLSCNNPVSFRDDYYKKTEFPQELTNKVKYHLHS